MSNGVVPAPEHSWQSTIETAAVAFLAIDPGANVMWANAYARQLLKLNGRGTETSFSQLFPENERHSGEPDRLLEEARRGPVPVAREFVRGDGSVVAAEGTLGPADGGTFVLTLQPGAERARLQRAAERSNAELAQFAYTVSHDLKAPLRSVKSFSELLERRYKGQLDQDATEYIAYITGGAAEMERLLNDVVAYSQAGREDKTRPQPIDTTMVLQFVVMNVDPLAKQAGATITYDPLIKVIADQNQVATVFQHLLTNAIKFRGETNEALTVHVTSRRLDDDTVEFSVTDNGPGIDPQYHDRIFGVFKRLVGREIPGTGIGLAICRKIVEAHGGHIGIKSQLGQGSNFLFTLPAA